MKKMFVTLFLVAGLAFTGFSQAKTDTKSQQPKYEGTQAEIKFEVTTHNYGEVKKGGNGDCEFTYTNTGKAPLVLTRVYASCGCTIPKWSSAPLMPGQSEKIRVHYDTNRVGGINKTVHVESNAANGKVDLQITGQVIQ